MRHALFLVAALLLCSTTARAEPTTLEGVQELAELEERLHNAQQEPMFEAEPVNRQEWTAAAEAARSAEVEARLTVRTAEERANAVRGRADSPRRAATAERAFSYTHLTLPTNHSV